MRNIIVNSLLIKEKKMINLDKEDKLVSIKVIEPKGEREIKYIARTKECFDDINGNSYWSCRVEDIEEDRTYIFPFQYGYESQSEFTVKDALNIKEMIGEKSIIKFIKQVDCTEQEVKQHGQGIEENYISRLGYYYQD
mgnify:CR=1 FL=1